MIPLEYRMSKRGWQKGSLQRCLNQCLPGKPSLALVLACVLLCPPLHADDTEVFFGDLTCDEPSLMVVPAVEVDRFNSHRHYNEIYFALFRPTRTQGWPGNLKKYRLRETDNAILDSSNPPRLAVDADTGFFADNARSYWSNVADGKMVEQGGAESRLPSYGTRNIHTYYDGSPSRVLSHSANRVATDNLALTAAGFGVEEDERDDLIEWIRGKDVDDEDGDSVTAENRRIIGDPLHSRPVAVTYDGTSAEPDVTVFFGTNAGFLHAVDGNTGIEQFAFLPQDKFDEQKALRTAAVKWQHIYGLDGSATVRVRDNDGDGVVESVDGDFVHVFIGQRRGGRYYYALDVTDRSNPEMLWQIEGGTGDFDGLGQSWATPVLGRVNIGGTVRDVLYLSGGYDEGQDDTFIRHADDVGNALYIVDAGTGALLWSGGNDTENESDTENDADSDTDYSKRFADMDYSFPAVMSVADPDGDGIDNAIFIGDMGGQLWRFDIHNGEMPSALVTGGVVADLGVAGGANTRADNRRFYHAPDIALIVVDGGEHYAVSIGSGYRAHPLDTGAADRFYMLQLPRAFDADSSYTRYTESDLYDASANEIGEGRITLDAALSGKRGWYFKLPNVGEKVLSTPLTFRNTVTFTTYQPNLDRVDGDCVPIAGVSRLYQVRLEDASPVNQWDGIDGWTEADRSYELRHGGIVDEPIVVCAGDHCGLLVGAEQPPLDVAFPRRLVKSFWARQAP